jgi:tetracycline resistance element mobilization regulatory protein rteC
MKHLVLAETEFFALINETGNGCLIAAYNGFVEATVSLCHGCNDHRSIVVALAYAEIELQHHPVRNLSEERKEIAAYVSKALSFVRKMQKLLATSQVPPLSNPTDTPEKTIAVNPPALQWTGNTLDLVELIYGLFEMGCINNGEIPLKELSAALYGLFGLKTKECYRYYSAIKLRKNASRTYFLDKMMVKLNEKIRNDEELERMRK